MLTSRKLDLILKTIDLLSCNGLVTKYSSKLKSSLLIGSYTNDEVNYRFFYSPANIC